MWCIVCFVLWNIFLHVYAGIDCDSVHTERWQLSETQITANNSVLSETAVVLNEQPFCIILENYAVAKNTINFNCRDNFDNFRRILFSVSFDSRKAGDVDILIIKVEKAAHEMSTEWLCNVWKHPNVWNTQNVPGSIKFKVHVKGKEKVKLNIGARHLAYILTNLSVVNYDGVYVYEYLEGEDIDLVCMADWPTDSNFLQLRYYNEKGMKLFETDNIKSTKAANFRKKMREEHENNYVDCVIIATTYGDMEYIYRIIFKFKTYSTSMNPLKITVNNSTLVPAKDSENEDYQYRFYVGETLSITCEKDQNVRGKPSLGFDNSERNKKFIAGTKETPWNSTIILKTIKDLNNHVVKCQIDGSKKYSAKISLQLEQNDPLILGLSANDVIQQYSKNFATWVIDYRYTPDQTLNLTCVADDSRKIYHWRFRDPFEESSPDTGPYSQRSFALKKEDDGKNITCDIVSGMSIINLHLRSEYNDIFKGLTENRDLLIIIGCALVVSAVILTVGLIMYCRMRNKKDTRQESRENLTSESPIPAFPRQWSDESGRYTEEPVVMRTNSLYDTNNAPVYARPQKKAKRNSEHLYHTIDPIYNVPIIEGSSSSNYTNPAQNNNLASKNYNKDEEYAEVYKKEETYDYAISGNITTSEYAEPVYCEIP